MFLHAPALMNTSKNLIDVTADIKAYFMTLFVKQMTFYDKTARSAL